MRKRLRFLLGALILLTAGCSKPVAHDFTTPQGAILCLEDAYRAKDIEAAVKAKDFSMEARLMLEKLKILQKNNTDDELIKKTAEVLELGFQEIEKKGFPNMAGVNSTFPKSEPFQDKVVVVTEKCAYPDGRRSTQRLLVAQTDGGWRVLNPLD